MTGCNFAVAETGTFVVCTNEGNADLSANVPKLHIASIGIEKIIPRLEHLAVLVRLLSRPAAYRAAIATADVALAHLPRWVIYNGLNSWGRHREVPHPPKQTFHSWYQANRGKQ